MILKSVGAVIATVVLLHCGSPNRDRPSNIDRSIKPAENVADLTFNSFFRKFGIDSLFQAQRIKYPLKYLYYPDDSDKLKSRDIILGKWKFRNLIDDSLSTDFKPVIAVKDSLNATYTQQGIDNGIFVEYEFMKVDGKWYLVKMTNASD